MGQKRLAIGNIVPREAAGVHSKTITLSFVGNQYGDAHNSQHFNKMIVRTFTSTVINSLFINLDRDVQLVFALTSRLPTERLKTMMELLKGKSLVPDQRKMMEFILKTEVPRLSAHFAPFTSSWRIRSDLLCNMPCRN